MQFIDDNVNIVYFIVDTINIDVAGDTIILIV